jgi:DNA-binding GntR family transcriptional regulator
MSRDDSPFDKRTLRQRATMYVRDLVIQGELAGGQHIVETRLAEELGVSRATLREALRPLELEGLLVGDGRGHLLVRSLSTDEIAEVFDVRTALETLAASRLAERADRAIAIAALRGSLEALRDEDNDFAAQIAADLRFHEHLCELTGNATLLRSWRQLIGQIEMIIIAAGPVLASPRMRYEGHVAIVDAIESGDVEDVRAIVAAHMTEFGTMYLEDHTSKSSNSRHVDT